MLRTRFGGFASTLCLRNLQVFFSPPAQGGAGGGYIFLPLNQNDDASEIPRRRRSRDELLALFLLGTDDLAALVMTTVRTDRVRQAHLAAVAALYQANRHQTILPATAVASAL